MLHCMAFKRTDVSEERIASIIKVTRIVLLRSVLRLLIAVNVVSSSLILVTLMMETICCSEISVFT
jgi:hypothetical protein